MCHETSWSDRRASRVGNAVDIGTMFHQAFDDCRVRKKKNVEVKMSMGDKMNKFVRMNNKEFFVYLQDTKESTEVICIKKACKEKNM